eukprot:2289122-Amphidinium_carterae.1
MGKKRRTPLTPGASPVGPVLPGPTLLAEPVCSGSTSPVSRLPATQRSPKEKGRLWLRQQGSRHWRKSAYFTTLAISKLKGCIGSWHPDWSSTGETEGSAGNLALGCSSGCSRSYAPTSLQKWYTFIAKSCQVSQTESGSRGPCWAVPRLARRSVYWFP